MFRIKKLDIFIIKSFSFLLIGTFFICLFIFMMQFLWMHVDDMVGKGLSVGILVQFFYYSALSLVPVLIIFFFFQKYMVKGLTAGAVKG